MAKWQKAPGSIRGLSGLKIIGQIVCDVKILCLRPHGATARPNYYAQWTNGLARRMAFYEGMDALMTHISHGKHV